MGAGRVRGSTTRTVAFHWATYFGHRFGRVPRESAGDRAALRNILEVQALGDMKLALDVVEAVVDAPITGETLAARYFAFWAWVQARCPKKHTRPSRSVAKEIRLCIRGAA